MTYVRKIPDVPAYEKKVTVKVGVKLSKPGFRSEGKVV